MKAKVIQFPIDRVQQNTGSVYAMFSKEEADSFMKYHQLGVEWRNKYRKQTFYEGYPQQPPGEALMEGLVWFTDEQKNFGVWVCNKSTSDIVVNEKVEFGWSPFVRKSVGPPNEPVHIQSAEFVNTWSGLLTKMVMVNTESLRKAARSGYRIQKKITSLLVTSNSENLN